MVTKILTFNNEQITVKIWDTAGQERFRTITRGFYKKSEGILLVFDVTKKLTFTNIHSWISDITNNANLGTPVYLIANKIDLVKEREVSYDLAVKFSEKYNLQYFETSAKENIKVNEPFDSIAHKIYENKKGSSKDNEVVKLGKGENENPPKPCCKF